MILPANRHYLAPLLEPASVAVIGASERKGSIGGVLMRNMVGARFPGKLFAVNPRHSSIHGIRCYPSIDALPQAVDLAVIATPASTVPGLIEQCGRAGVRAAVVISAGFGESGADGRALEQAMLDNARRHGLRLLGPNCLGIMRPTSGLNATFARGTARAGSLGLISQSGAVCTAMLDWALPNRIGFSSVVSLGGSTDVDFGEIIDYLVNDPKTEHILLYIEGVRDARRFVSALRAAARVKPVILMKVGTLSGRLARDHVAHRRDGRHRRRVRRGGAPRRRRAREHRRPAGRGRTGARLAHPSARQPPRHHHQRRRAGRDGRRPRHRSRPAAGRRCRRQRSRRCSARCRPTGRTAIRSI